MDIKNIILSINPCIYGLNYHDPCAIIISDGVILYGIEEERINRIKGAKGIFPVNAVKECIDFCCRNNLKIKDVVIGYDPALWMDRLNLELKRIIRNNSFYDELKNEEGYNAQKIISEIIQSDLINRFHFYSDINNVKKLVYSKIGLEDRTVPITFYEHHLCHIASAYEVSGFTDALGIVVDGIGETESTSVWEIHNHQYKRLLKIEFPNSLGYFYAILTKFLNFKPWQQEGKTMALAPYGHFNFDIVNAFMKIINIDGPVYDISQFIKENSTNYLMVDEEKVVKSIERIVGFKHRDNEDPLSGAYADFAFAAQNILESAVINLINHYIKKTAIYNVCVAGGVFMNCKLNMVVREKSLAENYYVQPLAGDVGLAIGAGLLKSVIKPLEQLASLDYGPEYTNEEIEKCLFESGLKNRKTNMLAAEVAALIAEGKIVFWFEGKMEMGARALGSRSILADPRNANMANIINKTVKHRETWRPFACSILEDFADEVLESYNSNRSYPFMIEAFRVKKDWLDKIPAVIHKADGTTRPQTVSKKSKPLFYDLIKNFYLLTNCPLILNTSLNDKGEPIIMTPQQAIDFFKKISVDVLVIGSFIVEREKI